MSLFFSIAVMYFTPSIIISSLVWFFARGRVAWLKWEFFSIAVPILIWIMLALMNLRNKSLSNAGIEALSLGIIVGLIQFFPVIFPEVISSRGRSALISLFLSILAAVIIYFFMPTLPE